MDEVKATTIQRWLIKAEHDLRTARLALNDEPPVTDTACFHAQQCVEKSLKVYLVFSDQHVEKTHYLRRLVALCTDHDPQFDELMEIANSLTDYAVADRYLDSWLEISENEAREAVEMADHVLIFVRTKLNPEI